MKPTVSEGMESLHNEANLGQRVRRRAVFKRNMSLKCTPSSLQISATIL